MTSKFQKNVCFKMRAVGLININKWSPFMKVVYLKTPVRLELTPSRALVRCSTNRSAVAKNKLVSTLCIPYYSVLNITNNVHTTADARKRRYSQMLHLACKESHWERRRNSSYHTRRHSIYPYNYIFDSGKRRVQDLKRNKLGPAQLFSCFAGFSCFELR